jgi:hypothetical protein
MSYVTSDQQFVSSIKIVLLILLNRILCQQYMDYELVYFVQLAACVVQVYNRSKCMLGCMAHIEHSVKVKLHLFV